MDEGESSRTRLRRIVTAARARSLLAASASDGALSVTTSSTESRSRAAAGDAAASAASDNMRRTPRLRAQIVAVPCGMVLRRADRLGHTGNREVEPERRAAAEVRGDLDLTAHSSHELAADVEAEAGAADAARQIRIEPVELLEDPLVLVDGDPEPFVLDREADPVVVPLESNVDPAAARGVLDGVLDEIRQHLADLLAVAGRVGQPRRRRQLDRDARRRVEPRRLDDGPRHRVGVEALALEVEPAGVQPGGELAREQELVDDRRQPVCLVGEEGEQLIAARAVERRETLLQGQRCAVDRCKRRAQLVRHGGDEVSLCLIEAFVLGDVAERVDGTVGEADAGGGDPELAGLGFERHGCRPRVALIRLAHGNLVHYGVPPRNRLLRTGAEDAFRSKSRDPLGGAVPEADEPAG